MKIPKNPIKNFVGILEKMIHPLILPFILVYFVRALEYLYQVRTFVTVCGINFKILL